MKIKSVNIQKFRGIVDTTIELDGKNLLLKGDNGTGKTSIVSAIEFFFTGNISPLEGVKGLSTKKHGPHVKFDKDDSIIEVTFNDGSSLSRTFSEEPIVPSNLKDFFIMAKEQKFILHRGKILEFIIRPPAEKYKAIASIIGVDSLEPIELNLKKIRDKFESDFTSLKEHYNIIRIGLSKLLEKDINVRRDILIGLNNKLKEYDLPKIKNIDKIEEYSKDKFENIIKKRDSEGTIMKLNDILTKIQIFRFNEEIFDNIKRINQMKEKLEKENTKRKLRTINLLNLGHEIISEEKINICPLCQQNIDTQLLINSIEDRLKIISILSLEHSDLSNASSNLFNKLKSIIDNIKIIQTNIIEFKDLRDYKNDLNQLIQFFDNYIDRYSNYEDYKLKIQIKKLSEKSAEVKSLLIEISSEINKIIERFKLTDVEKKVFDIINLLQQVKTKDEQMISFGKELKDIETQFRLADKIYVKFSETKKEEINRIYRILKDDINKYYQFIHSDDPHKNIDIQIDPTKRASVVLKIDSFDRIGEDPRAFTSEGHLDTLGICIFLAFVKKFNKGFPLLILDDIVTTVDANHRKKIASLLLREFTEFQMIITTHDGIWYEQLCADQRVYGVQSNFKNYKIIGWDVEIGPKIIPFEPKWMKIQKNLDNGDHDVAGMLARRYLEWILKEICIRIKGQIEYRRVDRYTVGELFNSAKTRMKNLINRIINSDDFKTKINRAFTNLESNQFMANLLAHDNPLIDQLSDTEISDFCHYIHALYETFLCSHCNNLIKYEKDLKEIRCVNPKCGNPFLMRMKK